MKHDYTKLDTAIIDCITAGGGTPLTFTRLSYLPSVRSASEQIEADSNVGKPARLHTPAWRIVDRRLQALRKAGRIKYQRKPEGWLLAD